MHNETAPPVSAKVSADPFAADRPRMGGPFGQREVIAMMAFIMALHALAIDAMLPSLGAIGAELGVDDPNRRQLVVGLFLLSTGLGCLIPGALADRYGRKPVLFVGFAGYALFAVACAFVTSFDQLLALRLCQGLATSAFAVLPATIVRDRFDGDRMARTLSLIFIVFMIVPVLAPSLGALVAGVVGWRGLFAVLGAMALLLGVWAFLRLPETLHLDTRQPIVPATIARNMVLIVRTRESIGYVIASALTFGAVFGYINSAQQLIGEHFGAGADFPWLFGLTASTLAIANFVNSRIVEAFGARRVSHTGLIAFIVVAGLQVWAAHWRPTSLYWFLPLMSANLALLGFLGANFGSIALQPFHGIAGSASSVQAFVRMVVGAVLGIVIGQSYDDSARPIAHALLLCGIGALALVLFSERGTLFRRLQPPGTTREPAMAPR